ncbi:MAG: NAD(P)H-hydrate epimerase [Gaiellales bacterium]
MADIDSLRGAGLGDRAIVDANQVVAYFNYVNRIANGLGVELEHSWEPETRRPRAYGLARPTPLAPSVPAAGLPVLDLEQSREMDRIMIEDLGITLERMMENAGRSLALVASERLGGDVAGRRLLVLAGTGGNGGGGLVAARHLANAGADVVVLLPAGPEQLTPVPRVQHNILRAMGVPVTLAAEDVPPVLMIDALLGYGLSGPPREPAAALIVSTRGQRVVSLDVPSGLEVGSGRLREPFVRAEATVALAAPKLGLLDPANGCAVGDLYLADISVPPLVLERLGFGPEPLFAEAPIVRVTPDAAAQV